MVKLLGLNQYREQYLEENRKRFDYYTKDHEVKTLASIENAENKVFYYEYLFGNPKYHIDSTIVTITPNLVVTSGDNGNGYIFEYSGNVADIFNDANGVDSILKHCINADVHATGDSSIRESSYKMFTHHVLTKLENLRKPEYEDNFRQRELEDNIKFNIELDEVEQIVRRISTYQMQHKQDAELISYAQEKMAQHNFGLWEIICEDENFTVPKIQALTAIWAINAVVVAAME